MNIGIFTDTYYPEINGVANSSYELKKGLEKMGHKVYVFTVTNPNAEELEEDVFTNASRIIILKIEQQSALGIIVDEVKEVVTLGSEEIDKVAHNPKDVKSTFINGIGKNGDDLISLFDISSVVDEKENS